uniref:BTB domain-containing protein n=1 Tax=Anopheles minimus TaxID=112268 RepID=A0A182W8I2_9DIPT
MTSPQSLSLRWNDYAPYIAGAFESLRYEEELVDVTLYCEGRKIRAHKMLLSACSVYFKDVFKENQCQHPIIIFKNVKYSDLYSLVEFMYKGEVHVLQESLPSFLQTANMLSVRGLSDPVPDEQALPTTTEDQPTSMLAQQILQTQSRNMNSATITTDQVYFALPSNSSFAPPIKTEPQPPAPPQYISKVLLKPTNDLTAALSNPIVPQVQQQPSNSGDNSSHQSTTATQAEQQHLQTHRPKPTSTIAMIGMDEQIVTQGTTSQSDQSKQSATALQELVDSVLSTARPVKIARIFKQSDSTAIGEEGQTAKTTSTANPNALTNKLEPTISEFINVGEGMATTSGDSNAYTQPEDFEMVCDNVANHSESEDPIEQRTSFEMQIVDMGVDNKFLDEDELTAVQTVMGGTDKTQEKKYKCDVCDKRFVTWKSLSMHSQIHSGRTKCNICGAVLSRTANLKRHMKLKHEP